MKFKNKETGVVVEPRSKEVEAMYKADGRFKAMGGSPAAGSDSDDNELSAAALGRMNKDALLALAAEKGAEVADGATNAEIVEAILQAEAGA